MDVRFSCQAHHGHRRDLARDPPTARSRAGHQQAAYHSTAPLKPSHGVSLHAVLVLPALAWLLSRTSWSDVTRQRIVYGAVGGYAAAVVGAGVWAALTC